jgi:siroheme synthase-like protein
MLDGAAIDALVVGGGTVAARKAGALLAAGARLRLVAPRVDEACESVLAAHPDRVTIVRRAYRTGDIGDALLVVAATDDRDVNATVARDALALRRLVNVTDAGGEGNCTTPATHRAGPLTIAVSAGGAPAAAVRIRDAIAARFDSRYGDAVTALGALRARILGERGGNAWRVASASLAGADFCESVERGTFRSRIAQWD